MTSPFDFDREDWYPPWPAHPACGPGMVCTSSGYPRPPLATPVSVFTVHYGGAGTSWTDHGDTLAEAVSIEEYARGANKPNEYNSIGDTEGQTVEYAGPFRAAHSAGENGTAWGHLCLYGLETLTEAEAQGLIRSCRRARAQALDAGYLTPDHRVKGHGDMPGAATPCPGPLRTNPRWWAAICAPLTTDEPAPPVPPPAPGDTDMIYAIRDTKGFGGALFTLDGHPMSPEVRDALMADDNLTVIDQDHRWWREATREHIGEIARRAYGDRPVG